MSADSVIARRPPDDGQEWDAQCARCGSSVVHLGCPTCGGDGFVFDDDDPEVSVTAPLPDAIDAAVRWLATHNDPTKGP